MKMIVKNPEEMSSVVKKVIGGLLPTDNATILGLYGNLGSGKTTFTQELARQLDVKENVVSPTFVIEKIYKLNNQKFTHLIHIDAYRIEKSSEMTHLGWNEIIKDAKNLIVVEWPERIADIMPTNAKKIFFKFIDETTREIEI